MSATWRYGDVLRPVGSFSRPLSSPLRVQFIRYETKPSRNGMWFIGLTIRGDGGMLAMSKVGRINSFPVRKWMLDE